LFGFILKKLNDLKNPENGNVGNIHSCQLGLSHSSLCVLYEVFVNTGKHFAVFAPDILQSSFKSIIPLMLLSVSGTQHFYLVSISGSNNSDAEIPANNETVYDSLPVYTEKIYNFARFEGFQATRCVCALCLNYPSEVLRFIASATCVPTPPGGIISNSIGDNFLAALLCNVAHMGVQGSLLCTDGIGVVHGIETEFDLFMRVGDPQVNDLDSIRLIRVVVIALLSFHTFEVSSIVQANAHGYIESTVCSNLKAPLFPDVLRTRVTKLIMRIMNTLNQRKEKAWEWILGSLPSYIAQNMELYG
jgi:hypothetical protein